MKVLFITAFIFGIQSSAIGQAYTDWFYFDKNWKPVADKSVAAFYRYVEQQGDHYKIIQYYAFNNAVEMEGIASKIFPPVFDGQFVWYYESGIKREEGQYKNGERTGTFKEYYKEGSLRDEVIYSPKKYKYTQYWSTEGKPLLENGNGLVISSSDDGTYRNFIEFKDGLQHGNYDVSHNSNDTVFNIAEKGTTYKGGENKLNSDLRKRLNYPKDSKIKLFGTVSILCIINKDGTIQDAKVLISLQDDYDKEALAAVNSIGEWSPAIHRGRPVKMKYVVPIRFLPRS